ncbi:hypothetical protein JJ456_19610 [Klebsiella pneumoniae]|nr:hypothetical protein JJ674_19750 [Klebsiella pneumoniae]UMH95935.1 hypothetical protein JJ469_19620 [Klebsiella pneumoniae]UMI54906.1 hypothetical protein JJ456_19610 [Klebsiella pneumoniae]
MVSKNSEAPLAATFGASIENNREGNIDMNSVQNKELRKVRISRSFLPKLTR